MKIGATATPVTKDPQDLFGLFNFIQPTLFNSFRSFAKTYIKYGGPGRIVGFRNMEDLKKKIAPYLLVKTKEEVSSQLPELMVTQRHCEMTPQQSKANDIIMMELDETKDKEYRTRMQCKTEAEVKSNESLQQLEGQIMALQTFAQEIVCSPELLKQSESKMAQQYYFKSDNPKLEMCAELVEQIIDSGEKVCIFSRYERMQNILTERIHKIDKNIKIAYVNGSLDSKKRYEEVYDKFQAKDEYKVLLMSEAGAEGRLCLQ